MHVTKDHHGRFVAWLYCRCPRTLGGATYHHQRYMIARMHAFHYCEAVNINNVDKIFSVDCESTKLRMQQRVARTITSDVAHSSLGATDVNRRPQKCPLKRCRIVNFPPVITLYRRYNTAIAVGI